MRHGRALSTFLFSLGLAACSQSETEAEQGNTTAPALDSDSGTTGTTSGEGGGAASTDEQATSTGGQEPDPEPVPIIWDVSGVGDLGDGVGCFAPPPAVCDAVTEDPWQAIGLNCEGGTQVDGAFSGNMDQIYVHTGNLGTYVPAPFPPTSGEKMVILSSGRAVDMLTPGLFASTNMGGPGGALPPPLDPTSVHPVNDCIADPGLIGMGDCSNTIEDQWNQGNTAFDYAELRFTATVPMGSSGFSYDLAMFSTEYPGFYQTQFNDMYIAWLESEIWTGNVSFDEAGAPISLNAGFLDYKDAPNDFDCPAPCVAPELQGTAMEEHAGTKWLTTTAPVAPGEQIELIFAIFDLSDGVLDTVVLLDNFRWNCSGGPPVTIPG